MLISPYSQRVLLRPVTLASQLVLVMAILLGSNAPLELALELTAIGEKLGLIAWLLLYLLALAGLLLAHGINWITWLFRYRLLLVLLLVGALLTIPWSVDPALSFSRFVHLVGTTIVGIYIGFAIPPAMILRTFSILLAGLLAISAAAITLAPDFALEFHEGSMAWKGILDNKNTLGFWAAVGVMLYSWFVLQAGDRTTRLLSAAALLLCLAVLIQSRSAGSIIGLTVAVSALSYIVMARKLELGVLAMALLGILITILAGLVINSIDVAAAAGRSTDLTGRTEIWQQTWKLIQQRPLTGYGYGTLWFPTEESAWIQRRYTDFTWTVYHAHNGLLQMASEIGLPLTAIALLFIVQQLVEIIHCQYRERQSGALFILGFVLVFLVSNYSEARFMQSRELFWLFFIGLPISLVRQVRLQAIATAGAHAPDLDDRRVRYPDEIIPNPTSKLKRLQETKKARRLIRGSLRLTQHNPDE